MKEVLTIPFEFDTSPIEERLQEDGFEMVLESIQKESMRKILETLPGNSQGYYKVTKPNSLDDVNWHKVLSEWFVNWLNDHTEEIVDEAAILLASKGVRKKKWREVLAELREAGELDG